MTVVLVERTTKLFADAILNIEFFIKICRHLIARGRKIEGHTTFFIKKIEIHLIIFILFSSWEPNNELAELLIILHRPIELLGYVKV